MVRWRILGRNVYVRKCFAFFLPPRHQDTNINNIIIFLTLCPCVFVANYPYPPALIGVVAISIINNCFYDVVDCLAGLAAGVIGED